MKNQLTLLIGIVVLVILLTYMFTYQVRYDEVAVLTTFDSAEAPDREAGDEGSLKTEPGLYFKAPWPIQKVYNYSTQIHLLEDRLEEIQTADNYAVIMKLYLAWRIENPYDFFRSLKSVENAQKQLEPLLRDLKGVISRHTFEELVNSNQDRLALREIEEEARRQLEAQLAGIDYGIEIEQVGISRIILPEATTQKVFERMRATRERMAEQARAGGRAQAATIQSEAQSARDRILAFAERRAQAIRAEGDAEANRYFAAFTQDPEFAVFLTQMQTLQEILGRNTTFVLDANKLWFLSPLRGPQPAQTAAPAAAADTDAQASLP